MRPNRRVLAHISEKITQDKPRMVTMVKLGGQPWTIALPSPGLKKTEHWTGYFSDGPEPVCRGSLYSLRLTRKVIRHAGYVTLGVEASPKNGLL